MPDVATVTVAGVPAGYRVHEGGGISSLPWPDDPADLPPSLAPGIIRWAEGRTPDSPGLVHHMSGEPWRFTTGQKRFLHMLYAIKSDGSWLYRRACQRRSKGAGKDPFGAALAICEACGPVRFDCWDDRGRPVGKPVWNPLVQIATNSLDQGKDLLRVANQMMGEEFRAAYEVDCGKQQTYIAGGIIEILSNSEATAEGDPATFVLANETHHMTRSSGRDRIAVVGRRNAGKSPNGEARVVELTNAHMPGEDSIAERYHTAWTAQVAGKTVNQDMLYDSLEAHPGLDTSDPDQYRQGITQAYAEAPWVSVDRIHAEAMDTDMRLEDSVRFYLNLIPETIDAWVAPAMWDACADTSLELRRGDEITLFLDCSKSDDATALVACRVKDGAVFPLGCWQRPRGKEGDGWLAPRDEVADVVAHAFVNYRVQWYGVDPSPSRDDDDTEALYWGALLDQWHREYGPRLPYWATPGRGGHAVSWDMRWYKPGGRDRLRQFAEEADATYQAIEDGMFKHNGDALLRLHVTNAKRKPNQWGVSIGKSTRDSQQKIDLAVAMLGALVGRRVVTMTPAAVKKQERRRRTGRRLIVA